MYIYCHFEINMNNFDEKVQIFTMQFFQRIFLMWKFHSSATKSSTRQLRRRASERCKRINDQWWFYYKHTTLSTNDDSDIFSLSTKCRMFDGVRCGGSYDDERESRDAENPTNPANSERAISSIAHQQYHIGVLRKTRVVSLTSVVLVKGDPRSRRDVVVLVLNFS